jgi:LuxR family maltose regulon positive regulatory protein
MQMQGLGIDVEAVLDAFDHGGGPAALSRLGRTVAAVDCPFVLVVDNAHALNSSIGLPTVRVVADHIPPGCQLVLASRTVPDLSVARLRATRRLLQLGGAHLAIRRDEATAFMAAAGVELEGAEVEAIRHHTEGWALGLAHAAAALRNGHDVDRLLSEFATDAGVAKAYLRHALLEAASPDSQAFLLRTSVLSLMCGELCDALLQTTGSADVLRDLEREGRFVTRIDGRPGWYRYHRLVKSLLRSELHSSEPDLESQLHTRAAAWWEPVNGTEAIRHAKLSGNVATAARMIWAETGPALGSGHRATVEHWLATFSGTQAMHHAKLALAAAWCALEKGNPVEYWIAAAEQGGFDTSLPGEADSVAAGVAVLRATLARRGVSAMHDDAASAQQAQRPDDPWRTFAQFIDGVALHLSGHSALARIRLEETERHAAAIRTPGSRVLARAQLALIAVGENDWIRARRLIRGAQSIMRQAGLEQGPLMGQVACIGSLLLAADGRAREAAIAAERGARMISLLSSGMPWYALQSWITLVRTYLLLGDSTAAKVALGKADKLSAADDSPVLATALRSAHRMVDGLLSGDAGPASLTAAEMRVLRYLPTHLSFEQIGTQLHTSRNTVKTQAIAAYRKLCVSSRVEAVERAATLGLLESSLPEHDRTRPAEALQAG